MNEQALLGTWIGGDLGRRKGEGGSHGVERTLALEAQVAQAASEAGRPSEAALDGPNARCDREGMTADKANHSARVGDLFDSKAQGWGKKYAAGGQLAARLRRFEEVIGPATPRGARALDFGCGSGELAAHLAQAGLVVTGVDISRSMLDAARRSFEDAATWTELPTTWTRLPFDDRHFDAAVSSSALEYVPEVDLVLREVARVLKPGGLFAFTVPDVDHPVRVLEGVGKLLVRKAGAVLPRLPGRLAAYADYLELSKNRIGEDGWTALAKLAGFERVSRAEEPGDPLKMLVFRRV